MTVPANLASLLLSLEATPPLSWAAFMFGVSPAVLVYSAPPPMTAQCDQRPVNIPASILHPDRIEVRGHAVILIGERTVSNQNEVEKTIEEVKRHFSDSIGEVRFGRKRVIVTQRGKPSVALVSLDDLEVLRKHSEGKGEAA